jgi:hypothetical protein
LRCAALGLALVLSGFLPFPDFAAALTFVPFLGAGTVLALVVVVFLEVVL